ncbi:transglutaminase [Alcaligenaceae bacterium SJ-26]|nr:transglutaminase [Alcaligenaceae bacterium SJ-26]
MMLRPGRARGYVLLACAWLLVVLSGLVWSFDYDRARVLQLAQSRYGASAVQAVEAWFDLMERGPAASEPDTLRMVNDFWNSRVQGSTDQAVWGQEDYWATPLESLGKRAGDCEDYVIGKYFSLIRLGVAPEKLRFVYVRARIGGIGSQESIAHMVLGYYPTPNAEPLVLDNLVGTILPASQRRDLTPVFSFNAQGIYAGGQTTSVDRISRWRDLLTRMQQEGFQP